MTLEFKDVISPIVAGVVAGAVALLSRFLQHKYWTRQKLFDQRMATIDQVNRLFAQMADLRSRNASNPLSVVIDLDREELVTKVQALFGDGISAHFNSTVLSLLRIQLPPDAALMLDAKVLRDTTLFAMYQAALKGRSLTSKITAGFLTLPEK